MRNSGRAEVGTFDLDRTFLETTIYYNRVYQNYAIDNLSYLVPIDEVRKPSRPDPI